MGMGVAFSLAASIYSLPRFAFLRGRVSIHRKTVARCAAAESNNNMPSSVPTRPHGTPMSRSSSSGCASESATSVASFNLLAPLYIRPVDQRTGKVQPFASFEWISPEDSERLLGNESRLPRLVRSMQSCGCDFICVQELQLEREEEQTGCVSPPERGNNGRSRREEYGSSDDDAQAASQQSQFVLPQWITPLLQSSMPSNGNVPYEIILPPQAELEKIAERNRCVLLADVAVTNAIFYRPDRWTPDCNGESGTTIILRYPSIPTCC